MELGIQNVQESCPKPPTRSSVHSVSAPRPGNYAAGQDKNKPFDYWIVNANGVVRYKHIVYIYILFLNVSSNGQ